MKFLNTEDSVDRLCNVYAKHGNIIVATDFDDTVYPFHSKDDFSYILELLKRCSQLGFPIVVYTSAIPERYAFMVDYLNSHHIRVSGINRNVSEDIPYGKGGAKIYYNILLDDKAGLGQACTILEQFLLKIDPKIGN